MISRLSGILLEKQPPLLVIDVNGVGYEVEAPSSVFGNLPETGKPVVMVTHLQVSQDHQTLYGFSSTAERTIFRQLMKVSGIGAKLALTILSGASGDELARYVADKDTASLTRLPGIGKKTAERIIIEMRDKLEGLPVSLPQPAADGGAAAGSAVSEASNALRALGYKNNEINHMMRSVAKPDMDAAEIIRKALQSRVNA
ncbi:MAG: Holliday junction branch migration protein RuvA [Xanthomonadales bacterium]|nr:Holliday junction branch migration protein RuvA [Gammaproteobacteria bacterium]NNE04954.1 Holliday junction branch migration protein RuvA [Xanthomonadales bacterium]NNL94239.1 Holliday junction branch migration protein RuvA [Xanthomonadales bacterium]